jgi:hypothetical protein
MLRTNGCGWRSVIGTKLIPHPGHPPFEVGTIAASAWREGDRWHFRYLLDGTSKLILPDPAAPGRADELWRTTCFEAFVGSEGTAYREYNFSPSGQWAAYAFDAPRDGMRDAEAAVEVWLEGGEDWIAVEAAVRADLAPGAALGLTAVIEEEGGRKSYWALAHTDGAPDFHDPSCFLGRLPE